jgi:hypothetical protein
MLWKLNHNHVLVLAKNQLKIKKNIKPETTLLRILFDSRAPIKIPSNQKAIPPVIGSHAINQITSLA